MAIHVRMYGEGRRRAVKQRWHRSGKAGAIALLSVVLTAVILYLIRILLPAPPHPHFSIYSPDSGGGGGSAASSVSVSSMVPEVQHTVQPVIVVADPLEINLDEWELELDIEVEPLPEEPPAELEALTPDDDADAGGGSGTGSGSGEGSGAGPGSGSGSGGGHGSGRRGSQSEQELGYNDDVQIVLVLDASGSMNRLFRAVSSSLEELMDILRRCLVNGGPARVNVGVVVYGQNSEGGQPQLLCPFSQDASRLRKAVSGVECGGKNECCGEAVQFALMNFPWNMRERQEILKLIFIAGDEAFHQGKVTTEQAMTLAREKGVIVNTIYCGPENEEWKQAAQLSGGEGLAYDPKTRLELLNALLRLETVPMGDPESQEAAMRELEACPTLPENGMVPDATREWFFKNEKLVIRGFGWDAVEMYRRAAGKCTLDSLGGRGNLPRRLRHLSDEQVMEHLRRLADKRESHIRELHRGFSFVEILLDTMIRQAAARHISISR